ncbi:non-ribosomal peptide synthetase [Nostoc sp. TCL26-01]|uniref:non-ribosomal peptide synthetase n=1 Tax=Nostoc sp. TCL26-01 TaxID=2576904 RepID=UPI0015B972E5|nr:non-ribosomal peptide synthetase [Nostoc sp. TCL26-01]QLE58472.1 amino acid adenylation domain-containing protein [Nostoc sp. TCL26-01]
MMMLKPVVELPKQDKDSVRTIDTLLSELHQLEVKLWLEGERLRYRAPKDVLSPQLLAELKERKLEVISFLQQVSAAKVANKLPPIVTIPKDSNLPLSFSQERLWLQHQLEPDSPINNMPYVYRLQGKLNFKALERSQNEMLRRHEILRTIFVVEDGQPVQQIKPEITVPLTVIDLQKLPPDEKDGAAKRAAEADIRRSFDLEQGPMVRLTLFQLHPEEYILIVNLHRIVCDGTSCDIFFRELLALYQAFCKDQPSPLAQLPVQYGDFAHWQRQCLQGDLLQPEIDYWQEKLKGDLSPLPLPTDYPRPPVLSYRGSRRYLLLPPSLSESLNNLSQQTGSTLFMTLMAAFKVLLYRYTGQEDILISFSHGGRTQVEIENLIGPFTKTLALRTLLGDSLSFRELLKRVRDNALEADTHQNVPFEKLTDELGRKSRWGRLPLLQVLFALNPPWKNDNTLSTIELPELTINSLFGYVYVGETKFDLSLVMRETDQGVRAVFEYNEDLFEGTSIAQMLECFQVLLENIVTNPDCSLAMLPILKPAQKQQLLVGWNNTACKHTTSKFLCQAISEQVQKNPQAIALIIGEQQLTYQELNARANQLANYLLTLDLPTATPVAIYMQPSWEMVVAILGVLKAGKAFTLLDSIHYGQSSPTSLVLTQSQLLSDLPHHQQVVAFDTQWQAIAKHHQNDPDCQTTDDSLACVIYVPNPHGKPDGIEISHQNLLSHSLAMSEVWQLTPGDRVLTFAAKGRNAIVESLFSSFISGATAILQPQEIPNSPLEFFSLITQKQVTILNLPTAFWYELVNAASLSPQSLPANLRLVMVGGEKVAQTAYQAWVKLFGQQVRWLNAYGSIETTFTATIYHPETANQATSRRAEIPIGKPIANTQIYILDRLLQPLPVGVPGEIYISGLGIAQGYSDRPNITSEKFISNPFSPEPNSRLYKTGDLARYLPDGNIEYLGRNDHQVKIDGFRIELAEIETLLNQHPAIAQAVVIANQPPAGNNRLIAYIVPQTGETLTTDELQSFLAHQLPDYMIPADYVSLESLPLTANGQIDHRALPTPNFVQQTSEVVFVAPRDQVEMQLVKIWEKILGVQPIGVEDNFFAVGGNSFLAVRLFSEIEKHFDKNFRLSTLLQRPTIAQLAEVIRQEAAPQVWEHLVVMKPGIPSKLPFFCVHAIWGNILFYRGLASYLDPEQPFYALQAKGLDGQQTPMTSIPEIASSCIKEMRKMQPQGPYLLGGFSWGGTLALEIAQQLQAQGQEVKLLAIFDTGAPIANKFDGNQASNSKPQSFWSQGLLRLRNLQKLQFSERLTYLWEKLYWHLTAGRVSIIYRFYLHYVKRSLPELFIYNVVAANYQAYKKYVAQEYPGKITLFRAINNMTQLENSPDLRWGQIATNGVEIYEVLGTSHTGLMEEPHVKLLAQQLQSCLEQLQPDKTTIKEVSSTVLSREYC